MPIKINLNSYKFFSLIDIYLYYYISHQGNRIACTLTLKTSISKKTLQNVRLYVLLFIFLKQKANEVKNY